MIVSCSTNELPVNLQLACGRHMWAEWQVRPIQELCSRCMLFFCRKQAKIEVLNNSGGVVVAFE